MELALPLANDTNRTLTLQHFLQKERGGRREEISFLYSVSLAVSKRGLKGKETVDSKLLKDGTPSSPSLYLCQYLSHSSAHGRRELV